MVFQVFPTAVDRAAEHPEKGTSGMNLSLTPSSQALAGQLRIAAHGDGGTAADATQDDGAVTTRGAKAGSQGAAGAGAESGGSSSVAVEQLQKRLQQLQKQLQQEQQELAAAQERQYSSENERTAIIMALQSRIASTSAAMQATAAALAEAIRNGGGGAGALLSTSA